MQKMQALLPPAPLTPVSNRHIFFHGDKYAKCLNVADNREDSIVDSLLSTLLNLQFHHNPTILAFKEMLHFCRNVHIIYHICVFYD